MNTFALIDDAANTMSDIAGELEAAAALVGQRDHRSRPGDDAIVLTVQEANGFAGLLGLIARQLRQAEADLRNQTLERAG
jgi:hypothetical protein